MVNTYTNLFVERKQLYINNYAGVKRRATFLFDRKILMKPKAHHLTPTFALVQYVSISAHSSMRELSNRKILIITVDSPPFVRLKPDIMTKLNKTSSARHAINYWPAEESTGKKCWRGKSAPVNYDRTNSVYDLSTLTKGTVSLSFI